MINDKKTAWGCVCCNRTTGTLHEIFHGTSNRKISVKYNLQVPLCPVCHTVAHCRELLNGYSPLLKFRHGDKSISKKKTQEYLCNKIGISRDRTSLAVNRMHDEDIEYLEKIAKQCANSIKNYEV